MTNDHNQKEHTWTRAEIRQAEHDLADAIKKYFGEVWRIKSDGEYIGAAIDFTHPLQIYAGVWRLCQGAIHRGATRAAGRIETHKAGTVLRMIIFFNAKPKEGIIQ